MKSIVVMAAVASFVLAGSAVASEQLAKSNGCLNCHAMDAKKVGPSIKDLSAKYKGKSDAAETITTKLVSAKGHPKVKTSHDDTKTIVSWMLSQ